MKILVACEESQRVCIEFRKAGHESYSCDILPCSGGFPQYHIQADVIPLLNGSCTFNTCDGVKHTVVGEWDMIIAFPPCTHLSVSGARHFEKKRKDGRQAKAIDFFCKILNAKTKKLVVENPVNIISGTYIKEHFPDLCEKYSLPIKPTQVIQPYEFGENARKKTCLWIKGVPNLKPTEIVKPELVSYTKNDGSIVTFSKDYVIVKGDRSQHRSKTYLGVAKAMAEQWGNRTDC